VHAAAERPGHHIALHFTEAYEQDRVQVEKLAEAAREISGSNVESACADQGHTGESAAHVGEKHLATGSGQAHRSKTRIRAVASRRVVNRSLAWAARFRRLKTFYERRSQSLAGLRYLAFFILMLANLARALTQSS
jgi:hypothetical protein